jgi:hypothetical protein
LEGSVFSDFYDFQNDDSVIDEMEECVNFYDDSFFDDLIFFDALCVMPEHHSLIPEFENSIIIEEVKINGRYLIKNRIQYSLQKENAAIDDVSSRL